MDGVWNANPITCIRPPNHQPMICNAISYYIILHHSISAHAMIFNTIPSHTIFPSTNTALTIWVLSSCALCSVLLLARCALYTVHTMTWCGVHCTIVAHTAGGQVCILHSMQAHLKYLSSAFDQFPASLCATQSALERGTQTMQTSAK